MNQIRAVASPAVNKMKGEIIRLISGRIKAAIAHGYFLEAITIEESLIADRLESLAATYRERPIQLSSLNKNLDSKIRESLNNPELVLDIESWWKRRNDALHQVAKISDSQVEDLENLIENRLKANKKLAQDGLALFNRVRSAVRKAKSISKLTST